MSGPIRIDPAELQSIASSCRTSSENMSGEAAKLRAQIDRLHDALQGVPSLAMADHFQELNGVLTRLSRGLDTSRSLSMSTTIDLARSKRWSSLDPTAGLIPPPARPGTTWHRGS